MKWLTFLLMAVAITSANAQTQFVCNYGSSAYVAGPHEKPKVNLRPEKSKYGFYINAAANAAEYINFDHGTKLKVGLTGSSSLMLVFTELVTGADNHFTATIFLKKNPDGTFPTVFSQHAWGEPAEFYRPSMKLGYCVQL